MRAFNHLNASSLEEASAALKQPGAVAMAGGGDQQGNKPYLVLIQVVF